MTAGGIKINIDSTLWYFVYYTAMNRNRTGSTSFDIKVMCLALAFMIGGSMLATGLMAAADCGMQCCCQIAPPRMHHSAQKQMRSSMYCCSSIPLKACDLQSARPYELPQVIPASCCGLHHIAFGPAVVINEDVSNGHNSGENYIFQLADPTFNSPPLYLKNHSYII